jgi:hypothetical protein
MAAAAALAEGGSWRTACGVRFLSEALPVNQIIRWRLPSSVSRPPCPVLSFAAAHHEKRIADH